MKNTKKQNIGECKKRKNQQTRRRKKGEKRKIEKYVGRG